MVSLDQFGHPRVGQQLPDALDIDIQFEAERHAFDQTAAHCVAHRQIDPCIQMVHAILEFEVGGSDFETPFESLRADRRGTRNFREQYHGDQQHGAAP
jgi:hypothetical protein